MLNGVWGEVSRGHGLGVAMRNKETDTYIYVHVDIGTEAQIMSVSPHISMHTHENIEFIVNYY